MIVPIAYFRSMPERASCDGSMEIGAPVVAGDGVVRYIKSIAELRDNRGLPLGWVYLAYSADGRPGEYAQANRYMSPADRSVLVVRIIAGPLSSVASLKRALPSDLKLAKC